MELGFLPSLLSMSQAAFLKPWLALPFHITWQPVPQVNLPTLYILCRWFQILFYPLFNILYVEEMKGILFLIHYL